MKLLQYFIFLEEGMIRVDLSDISKCIISIIKCSRKRNVSRNELILYNITSIYVHLSIA